MIARLLAVMALALCSGAFAQELPRPWIGRAVEGRVVDAGSGQPLAGVVLVARWNWRVYHRGGMFHGSAGFNDLGEALHIDETVSDADGRFRVRGFGPRVRGMGEVEEGAPALSVFKSGYEPVQFLAGRADADTIRLRRHSGTAAELAEKIAAFQAGSHGAGPDPHGGGLRWRSSRQWSSIPQMVLALHREKLRLGNDGGAILGADVMPDRGGEVKVLDAHTEQGIERASAVVSATWTLRHPDGRTRRWVLARGVAYGGGGTVSPWRIGGRPYPGWEVAYEVAPVVRVYAPGYQRSADLRWSEGGATVRLARLAPGREPLLAELKAWRADIDAALADIVGRKEPEPERREIIAEILEGQRGLVVALRSECRKITPDLRAGICFDDTSLVVRYFDESRNRPVRYELAQARPRSSTPAPSAIQAPAVQAMPGAAAQAAAIPGGPLRAGRERPGRFTIEPVK